MWFRVRMYELGFRGEDSGLRTSQIPGEDLESRK